MRDLGVPRNTIDADEVLYMPPSLSGFGPLSDDSYMLEVEMGTDRIHHGFWKFMDAEHRKHEPGNEYEHAIRDYHVHLDGLIGKLLEHVGEALVVDRAQVGVGPGVVGDLEQRIAGEFAEAFRVGRRPVAADEERGADAAAAQMRKLAFSNSYTGFSNVPAIQLAAKVADLTYDNLTGVFFTNSGSESNEGAFKAARFYWNLRGKPSKTKIIARERAYHGGTLTTTAMTGLPAFWKYFGPFMPGEVVHTSKPDALECDCAPNTDGECAHWFEAAILREGAENVAAIIAEPVKGAGGVWTPADGYFQRVREICDRYDVLFIADEVITGFGRTGKWFALEHWGVQPDILSIAKAITSGYIPMGAFIVSNEIATALQNVPTDARFMHAYTNSAHPTAAAVGLWNLGIGLFSGFVFGVIVALAGCLRGMQCGRSASAALTRSSPVNSSSLALRTPTTQGRSMDTTPEPNRMST